MKKKIIIGIGGVLAFILVIYVGFAIYFTGHYFFHTSVGSTNCSCKTTNYLIKQNEKNASNYLLSIKDRKENLFSISGDDISYKYISSGEEKKILKKQNPLLWPFSLFKKYQYDLDSSVNYDTDKLTQKIQSLDIFSKDYIEDPNDAYIDLTDEGYTVVDEVLGNKPIEDEIISEITQAVQNQDETITLSDSCYESPKVLASDDIIANAMSKIQSYTSATIHYDIDGVDENLDAATISSMLTVDSDYNVTLNEEGITDFVQHLASTYNTYGDVRKFKTSSGDTVKIGGGDYGWVIDKTKEAAQIKEDLSKGKAVEREPVYEQTALKSGLDDIGDTYIEIDYGKQHLWYYKEGKLITETDIVSGNISQSNGSVDGVYKIVYKEKDATLVGENYSSSVKYFMPFAYNIGIHDASWRSEFGGEIYKKSGSHGCVNVPYKAAKKLFSTVETGTPVVAYYRDKVKLTNTAAKNSNAYSYVDESTD